MDITINLKDLLFFVVFCLLITAGVFFIIMLYKLTQLIKNASKIIEANGENINKTLGMLPEAAKNINDTAVVIKSSITKVEDTVEGFGNAISETAATVNEGAENLLSFVQVVSNVVNVILSIFTSMGKK